jgi:hypothetical protein
MLDISRHLCGKRILNKLFIIVRFVFLDNHLRKGDTPMARSIHGMPRWVKAFALVAVAAVLMVIVLHLTGYGPGGHMHQP